MVLNTLMLFTPLCLFMHCSLDPNYSFFSSPTSEMFIKHTLILQGTVQISPFQHLTFSHRITLPAGVFPLHFVLTSVIALNIVLSFCLHTDLPHWTLRSLQAVKVLHSVCQQIWKTQQWSQDWKRSVFIPISKKGNAKECSNYAHLYSFHMPA